MKFRNRHLLSAREIGVLCLIITITIIISSILIGTNIALSRMVKGGGEFFVAREGAQAFLLDHTDPYSSTVASLTQELVYGRLARTGEDPYYLTIPFFLLPIYFPFSLISDDAIAKGIWLFINEISLAGTALLSLLFIDWHPRRFMIVFFFVTSILSYYSIAALLAGTPAILLGLVYLAVLFTYFIGQDEITGVLLVFTLFNWDVGCLFFLLVIWKIFHDKRWRVLYGFAMTFVILMAVSLLIYPGWVFPFFIAIIADLRAQYGLTSTAIIMNLYPSYGLIISRGLAVIGIIVLIYEWAAMQRADERHFIWAACLTLAVTPLLGIRTEMSHLVVLFPCMALIFAASIDRWRAGYWLTTLLILICFLVPWGLCSRWIFFKNQIFYDYLYIFYPFFTILGLYWTRWWFVRPPRTWLEHMRRSN